MTNKIYPCIWCDGNASELATFYQSCFEDVTLKSKNPITTSFQINGHSFLALNGGPMFRPNPSVSFYSTFETSAVIASVWNKLIEGGRIMMPLDKYEWNEMYGWVEDKFGVSWQLTLGRIADVGQQFIPALMFVNQQFGKATEAISFYTDLFPESSTDFIAHYPNKELADKVAHSQFRLLGQKFAAMDSSNPSDYNFSEGLSMIINCDSQEEIDHYWDAFTKEGKESQCGWLKDKFGMSWQIVPSILPELMKDPERAKRVTACFMKMKKFDIETLVNA